MTKADLISHVVEKTDLTRHITTVIVDTFFDSLKESLIRGEGIEIRGFGSFSVRSDGARKGRNPKNGKSVDVPSKSFPFFKVRKELKERVNY
jgi:integration host factor subunit beta